MSELTATLHQPHHPPQTATLETTMMRITLLKPHTHAGRKYPAGAKLTMEQHKAEWLIGLGVAEEADEPAAEAVPAAAQPKTAKAKE